MLSRSISSTLASPTAQAVQSVRICSAIRARRSGRTCLESFNPRIIIGCAATTHAATTGPASGPRPTSSMPPTKTKPFSRAAFSNAWRRCSLRRSRSYAFLALRCLGVMRGRALQGDASEFSFVELSDVRLGCVVHVRFAASPHKTARTREGLEIRHARTPVRGFAQPAIKPGRDVLGIIPLARHRAYERQLPLRIRRRDLGDEYSRRVHQLERPAQSEPLQCPRNARAVFGLGC